MRKKISFFHVLLTHMYVFIRETWYYR